MASFKSKTNIAMALMVFFAITLITGIILHLKKHGLLVEPRAVIKILHWVCGLTMCALSVIHYKNSHKMLVALKHKARWFYFATYATEILLLLTFLTGTTKLLSPVKIPHLGLWHYGLGIAMSAVVILHLFRGIPSWIKYRTLTK